MRIMRFSMLVWAIFILAGCGGGSPVTVSEGSTSGVVTVTNYVVPAGQTVLVSGDVRIRATDDIRIEGTLQGTPGTSISLEAGGGVYVTGAINARSGAARGMTTRPVLTSGGDISITGGSVTLGGESLAVLAGEAVRIQTSSLFLLDTTTVHGGAGSIILIAGFDFTPLTITTPSTSSATIRTTGGTINIEPAAGQGLIFKSSAGGASTINLTGGAVTIDASGPVSVGSGVTVSSDHDITVNTDGGTLANDGTVSATGVDSITTLQSAGDLVLGGDGTWVLAGSMRVTVADSLTVDGVEIGVTGGAGRADGGTAAITCGSLTVADGGLTVDASATDTGNGGTISIETTGASADLDLGNAVVSLSARGGSSGSSAGNGGVVGLTSARGLSVDASLLDTSPRGSNGNGGRITLIAGASLLVNGPLTVPGVGNGNGGAVTLTTASSNPFSIGAGTATSGVTGNISATGAGTGAGGTVRIEGRSALAVDVAGSIDTSAAQGDGGSLRLTAGGGPLSLTGAGTLRGSCELAGSTVSLSGLDTRGQYSASGNSVCLISRGDLTVGNVQSASGTVQLEALGQVGTGALAVVANSRIAVTGGDLLMRSGNATSGTILIGQGAALTTDASGNPSVGRIQIVIGTPPATPVAGTPPANVTVNTSNGGRVFFGTLGITALPPTSTITAKGVNIICSSEQAPSANLTLGGGVILFADP